VTQNAPLLKNGGAFCHSGFPTQWNEGRVLFAIYRFLHLCIVGGLENDLTPEKF
jgi:hypothetical protein